MQYSEDIDNKVLKDHSRTCRAIATQNIYNTGVFNSFLNVSTDSAFKLKGNSFQSRSNKWEGSITFHYSERNHRGNTWQH